MTTAWILYTAGATALSTSAFLSAGIEFGLAVAGMTCLMAGFILGTSLH